MSTQKWSDDDLDDLFRKSAEESDPAYDPKAWQDLQSRLNKRDRTILRDKLLRWGTPILLLLLITGGIIGYNQLDTSTRLNALTTKQASPVSASVRAGAQTNATTSPPQAVSATSQPHPPSRQTAGTDQSVASDELVAPSLSVSGKKTEKQSPLLINETTRKPTTMAGPVTDNPSIGKSITSSNRINTSVGLTPNKRASHDHVLATSKAVHPRDNPGNRANLYESNRLQLTTYKARRTLVAGRQPSRLTDMARQDAKTGGLGRQRSILSGPVSNPPTNNNTPTGNVMSDYYTLPTSSSMVTTEPESVVDAARIVWPTVNILMAKNTKWPAQPALTTKPTAPENTTSVLRPAPFKRPGFSVQLVVSPDLSSVGLANLDRPGSNLGVMVQYQLSERFSVQTGALWSTKLYNTSASDYVWPIPGYVHVKPEGATGKCTMFDIPLNVRYDVLLRPGGSMRGPRRWFVSGGVTSYFINREVYDYNYKNPNDPLIEYKHWDSRGSTGDKSKNFGFSNLNISIGYEQPISRRLSWQVEPFMKVPLQQIGYLKVRLLSTGAFLSLRYRL